MHLSPLLCANNSFIYFILIRIHYCTILRQAFLPQPLEKNLKGPPAMITMSLMEGELLYFQHSPVCVPPFAMEIQGKPAYLTQSKSQYTLLKTGADTVCV